MDRWCAWVDEQAAAVTLPDLAALRAEIATRRREREAEGKARMEKFLADATPGLSFEIAEAARVRLFRKAPADA